MSSALRAAITKLGQPLKTQVWQKATIVSGPPNVRVSFAEKVTLGSVMVAAILAPGAYILTTVKDNPGREIH